MQKIGPTQALDMTTREMERAIFRGASPSDHRGFSDAFTDEAIIALAEHEARYDWPRDFRDWWMSAYFAACDRHF